MSGEVDSFIAHCSEYCRSYTQNLMEICKEFLKLYQNTSGFLWKLYITPVWSQ